MFVAVDRVTNPGSEFYGTWYVCVSDKLGKPMKTIFRDKSKKACMEYAKTLAEKPHISNGVDYGAKW